MASEIPLTLQTAYADLLDRCSRDAFADDFPEQGVFTPKVIRGRTYWYFQHGETRKQRYVGAETPELLERINRHREARGDRKDRQALVSTLVRSAYLPRPNPEIGNVVAALANVGVFRLSGVLVGTVAYQAYSGLLGIRLSASALQTGDVDVAQSRNVSLAVEEPAPSIVEALQKVDPSFHPVPHMRDPLTVTSYAGKGGIRVEFLTPNEGPDTDEPAELSALGTDAQQLRFLDFLIHEPEGAVLLHGDGIFVLVPTPQRYALHKLIVARRRREGAIKVDKDLEQAEALLDALIMKRPRELRAAWQEAYERGKKWRQYLGEGLGRIDHHVRDYTLKAVGAARCVIPGLDLVFSASHSRYDFDRDIVEFSGEAGGERVRCAISHEALSDHFEAEGMRQEEGLKAFRANRAAIEKMARAKYLTSPVEDAGSVLLKSEDVERLRGKSSA